MKPISLTQRRPPKISVVIIAKNEEKNIERCLKSIEGIANEIILVDTGSTDKTNEIAERYRAKIHHHPWEDDFSKARNQSIQYATGDWLMVIDCDEEAVFVEGKGLSDLKGFLRKLPKGINAVSITLKDIQGGRAHVQFNTPKLFRQGSIHYEGIVHNKAVHQGQLTHCPLLFYFHYGYGISPEEKKKKVDRSIRLLEKRIKADKNDYEAYFYMAEMLGWTGDLEESVKYSEKYLEYRQKPEFAKAVYFMTALNYMKLNELKLADKWLLLGIKEMPDDLDLLYALTEFGLLIGKPDLIAKGAKNFIKQYAIFEKKRSKKGSHFTYTYTPEALAFCIYHLSMLQIKEGANWLRQMEKLLPLTNDKFKEEYSQKIESTLKSVGLQKND